MEPLSRSRRRWLQRIATWGALPLTAMSPLRSVAAPETIKFGQSAPITGPSQHWGIEYMRGIKLAFDDANLRGGIGGRRLELVTYDDLYEATAAQSNTEELINIEKVFGLIGYVGSEAVSRSLPIAARLGVPFIAPLTGDEALRREPTRWLCTMRAGDDSETIQIARTLATIDFRRTAVLQQNDADGLAALQSLLRSFTAAGMPAPTIVVKVARGATDQAEFTQRDVSSALKQITATTPQAVIFLTSYPTTAAAVRQLREGGFAGGCYATSLSSAAAIGPLLGKHAAGLSISQVVPSPFDQSRPLVVGYQKRLDATGGAAAEYVSLEGWIAARLVVEALQRAGASATRERFLTALESLAGIDLGGFPVRWDPARRQFSSRVSLTVLDARGRPRT